MMGHANKESLAIVPASEKHCIPMVHDGRLHLTGTISRPIALQGPRSHTNSYPVPQQLDSCQVGQSIISSVQHSGWKERARGVDGELCPVTSRSTTIMMRLSNGEVTTNFIGRVNFVYIGSFKSCSSFTFAFAFTFALALKFTLTFTSTNNGEPNSCTFSSRLFIYTKVSFDHYSPLKHRYSWSEAALQAAIQQPLSQERDSRLCSWRRPSFQGSYYPPKWCDQLFTVLKRYHIGESLLASVRHFLKFIDVDDTMKSHGFTIKVCDTTGTSNPWALSLKLDPAWRGVQV